MQKYRLVLATLVFATLSVAGCGSGRSSQPLLDGNQAGTVDTCHVASSSGDWADLHRRSYVFGLDMLIVQTSAPLTLVSASPIHAGGGLRVVNVALVPAGNYGSAENWGDGSGDRYSAAEWRDRQEFPGGILHQFKDPAALGYDPTAEPSAYQLVVGVQPANDAGGGADGMLIKYRIHGQIRSVETTFKFGIVKSPNACPHHGQSNTPVPAITATTAD
jgi:hypothetical protein